MTKQFNQSSTKFICIAEVYIHFKGIVQLQLMLLAIFPVNSMRVGWDLAI